MSSYAGMVEPGERWQIAAYVRALQLSRAVPADRLSAEDRAALDATGDTVPEPTPVEATH